MKLKTNVGNLDLILRVSVGLALVMLMALGVVGAWGLIGVVLIATGVARWCPLYSAMGIDTSRHITHQAHDAAPRRETP